MDTIVIDKTLVKEEVAKLKEALKVFNEDTDFIHEIDTYMENMNSSFSTEMKETLKGLKKKMPNRMRSVEVVRKDTQKLLKGFKGQDDSIKKEITGK